MSLTGKNAIVTGGTRGIGAATVKALAREGASVLIVYVSERSVKLSEAIIEEISSYESCVKGYSVRADMSKLESIELVQEAADLFFGHSAPVHIIVNNAGLPTYGPVAELTPQLFDDTFAVNAKIPFFLIQALLPRIPQGGRIVNITSRIARSNIEGSYLYTGSKIALEGLTRSLALELRPRGITANRIAPGAVDTEMLGVVRHLNLHAANEIAPPEAIAHAVLYLCHDLAANVTGATLPVNSGEPLVAAVVNAVIITPRQADGLAQKGGSGSIYKREGLGGLSEGREMRDNIG